MDQDSSERLEREVGELRARVARLESALRSRGVPIEELQSGAPMGRKEPVAATTPPPPPPPLPHVTGQPVIPRFAQIETKPEDKRSLESRIGSQWFNRIGILAMLIGVAWFLKLAFDNHWIGPLGRILIGLLAGAALIAWSEHFERRGFTAFSYSLKAIGSGTLYLSLWAAFSLYALLPASVAFAAMILVTAFNGYMAWVRSAELLALYAIVGGLTTPLLVSTGGNHEVTLFTYLLILDVAMLVLAMLRPWSRLLFAAFAGTVLFIAGWWFEFYTQQQAGRTAVFLTCFFLLFATSPRLVCFEEKEQVIPNVWDVLASVVIPLATAALGFGGYYGLLSEKAAAWGAPWIAVLFACFYLLMLRIPAQGRLLANRTSTAGLHLALAACFLTIAIPLKTRCRWLTVGWLAEGAALMWVSGRLRSVLLRTFVLICLALGLLSLVTINPDARLTPILNQRFATFCFGVAVFAFVAWMAHRNGDVREELSGLKWSEWAGAAVVIVNLLILVAVGWEIHNYWWLLRWRGEASLWHSYQIYAQFTYSAFFMLFGAALLATGFWRRTAFLRWQALILLAVSIGKVFLWDVSELSQGLRVLSFLGLGVLLLGVSFAYQRDWLNLRGQGERNP